MYLFIIKPKLNNIYLIHTQIEKKYYLHVLKLKLLKTSIIMVKKTEAYRKAREKRKANKKRRQQEERISTVRDRPLKSIVKAITWRIIASATTFTLALLFFGNDRYALEKATGIALTEAVIKMILYYLHERAWTSISWGRMRVIIRRNSMIRRKIVKRIMLKPSKK